MKRTTFWFTLALIFGLGTGAGAQAFRAVLLHVGTGFAPTALTATNGALNVVCQ